MHVKVARFYTSFGGLASLSEEEGIMALEWEMFNSFQRAKVPGGWFVIFLGFGESTTLFYPDPQHIWDGSSIK